MDLSQLQNAAKKDPESYKDDCLMQYRHFNSELEIFKLKPNTFSKKFVDQVSFFSHVSTLLFLSLSTLLEKKKKTDCGMLSKRTGRVS